MKLDKIAFRRPLDKYSLRDAIDRATSHLVRADYQFNIPGNRQRAHWMRSREHLIEARGALEEAIVLMELLIITLYGPLNP